MGRGQWLAGALALWGSALILPLRAQTPARMLTIGATPSCPRCQIVEESFTEVGERPGPGGIDEHSVVVVDARHRIYVPGWQTYSAGIQIFDSAGGFVDRIGKSGQAPGEYSPNIRVRPMPGDSLFVFDATLGRMTVLTPDYKVARTAPASHYAQLPVGHSFVLMQPEGTAGSLHTVTEAGDIVRSFGLAPSAGGSAPEREIAVAGSDGIWAAHVDGYLIEQWDTTGNLRLMINRSPEWYHAVETPGAGGATAPAPSITSIQQDSTGLLWVLIGVPSPTWAPHEAGAPVSEMELEDHFDTIVDVIDPSLGQLVATRRVDDFLRFCGRGLAQSYTKDTDQNSQYIVWRLSLDRAGPGGE